MNHDFKPGDLVQRILKPAHIGIVVGNPYTVNGWGTLGATVVKICWLDNEIRNIISSVYNIFDVKKIS